MILAPTHVVRSKRRSTLGLKRFEAEVYMGTPPLNMTIYTSWLGDEGTKNHCQMKLEMCPHNGAPHIRRPIGVTALTNKPKRVENMENQ